MLHLSKIFVSFFGIGYLPKAPGTWASLFTIPLLLLLEKLALPLNALLIILTLLFIISSFAAEFVQKELSVHDPGWIVIDEVLGMMVAWLFMPHYTPLFYALLFGAFRFFDIVKIWPASYFDKKVHHGYGTIADDIISGIFAGLFVLMVGHFV